MVTIILSIAIMIAVAAALSLKVLLGHQREVKRFGCGSFVPIDHGRAAGASTTCGVCGAQDGEACQVDDEAALAADRTDRPDFSRN